MNDLKFTSPSGETTIKLEGTGRLGTVAPKTQLHIKMDESVKYETPMTEIEEVKAQLKILEKKVALLEEIEKTPIPKMELLKDGSVYGVDFQAGVDEMVDRMMCDPKFHDDIVGWF